MKKNIMIAILALMLAVSAAGCGQKKNSNSALVDGQTTTQATDSVSATPTAGAASSGSEQKDSSTSQSEQNNSSGSSDNFAEDSDKKVNMNKIEGTKAKTDNSGKKGDGKMTTCQVAIDEVKILPFEGAYMIVVQYNFKNTSDSELNFAGEVYAEAYQDGMELSPAVFQGTLEGFSPETTMQKVEPGKSIKVQKGYVTSDPNTPIEVYVRDTYDQSGQAYLSQVFRLQ
mgnify:CR=1 FL=1